MTGWAYTPEDAAKDSSFGIAGASLLVLGFVGQSLLYAGVKVHASTDSTRIAAGAALAAAVLVAYLIYGVAFIGVFKKRLREAKQRHASMTPDFRWRPRFPTFWAFERVSDDAERHR
jgi:hypothetical protein